MELTQQLRLVGDKLTSVREDIKSLRREERSLESEKAELEKIIKDSQKATEREKRDWSREDFPWSSRVRELLTNFKIPEFRSLQLESINAVLSGSDLLLIMPTGGGKSLCYQIPALVRPGFCLVISPLISLMEDQIFSLSSLGVEAKLLSAEVPREEASLVYRLLSDPANSLKVLFVTPERVARSKRLVSSLEKAHQNSLLSLIVVDEVHCASQWGHDFRPDYKKLCIFKLQFPSVPLLGLTATATAQVLHDVQEILRLQSPLVLRCGFNRANLFCEVRLKPEQVRDQVASLVSLISREFSGESGIVYCLSKKDCEHVTAQLLENGLSAASYHADVPMSRRREVHHSWRGGEVLIVVSTVAFGLGIDKKNVRFVIHHSIPKSIANYYQECGRAGRDGRPARCVLFYRPQDYFSHSSMVMTEKTGIRNLNAMTRYCLDWTSCRRVLIAQHLNEPFDALACNKMCDNCLVQQEMPTRGPQANASTEYRDVCESLIRLLENASIRKERLTAAKLLALWKKECKPQSREVSGFACMCILMQALINGVFREDYHFTPYNTISYILANSYANGLVDDPSKFPVLNPNTFEFRERCSGDLVNLINSRVRSFNSIPIVSSNLHKPSDTNEPIFLNVSSDTDSVEECQFNPKKFCSEQSTIQYPIDSDD